MISYKAWLGLKPLTEFPPKSHARITVLFYVAFRAYSGYFWGSIEKTAFNCSCDPETAGRSIGDLEAVGAMILTPHNSIPPHVMEQIKKTYPGGLPPAKKVWRVTGVFTIEGKQYEYKVTGDGGESADDMPAPSNNGLSDNRINPPNVVKKQKRNTNKPIERHFTALTLADALRIAGANESMGWYLVQSAETDILPNPQKPPNNAEFSRIGATERAREMTATAGGNRWHFMTAKTWLAYYGYGMRWSMRLDVQEKIYRAIETRWKGYIEGELNPMNVADLDDLRQEIESRREKFPYQTPTSLMAKMAVFLSAKTPLKPGGSEVVIMMPDGERLKLPSDSPNIQKLINLGGKLS